jgi:cell division protein FtsW (lipid II flippase)
VQERITDWLSPWTTHKVTCPGAAPTFRQDCQSYQLVQSLYSIGHGGFGGTGLGHGIVTTPTGQQIVPDQNTDFIYSALAQELGLIGVAALLLLYMGFVLRGFRIALAATDGGITRVIPLTGITLPFVSYGGSSVVANFLLVAGLLLISHRANRQVAAT